MFMDRRKLMEGKHAAAEPRPINESLERHYQEEKKRLEANISELENALNEARLEIERLGFKIKLKDIEIDSLVKSIAGGGM